MRGIRRVRKNDTVGIEPSPFSGKKSTKSDTDSKSMEEENRDYVSEYFLPIILEKKCGVKVFNKFVLELFNSWEEFREEWCGGAKIYGVLKKPTFMGEMLARFLLEEKEEAKRIDFTDQKLPLKEMVAKHYFGELWKQKTLFLELLQKLRYNEAIPVIPHAVIEKFVDTTFVKSDKRAFIIKVFVEMAKNRGFKLGDIKLDEQKECDDFIRRIRKERFEKKITESEMMKGVEGFSWNKVYRIEEAEKLMEHGVVLENFIGRAVQDDSRFVEQDMIAIISKGWNGGVKLPHVIERVRGKKEITLPELGKIMEEIGYAKRKNGVINNAAAEKVMSVLEHEGIQITCKKELSTQEKELLLKYAEEEKGPIKCKKIRKLLMENGRVIDYYVAKVVKKAVEFLREEGYKIRTREKGYNFQTAPSVKQHRVAKQDGRIAIISKRWRAGVDNYFATKLPYVIERVRGKKEITLPELGKIMEEIGYAKRKSGLINNAAAEKVMRAVEHEGIQITCKKELSTQEKELLLKYAEEEKGPIRYKKIRKLLMENGRVIDYYVSEPAKKALEFLREKGYKIRTGQKGYNFRTAP